MLKLFPSGRSWLEVGHFLGHWLVWKTRLRTRDAGMNEGKTPWWLVYDCRKSFSVKHWVPVSPLTLRPLIVAPLRAQINHNATQRHCRDEIRHAVHFNSRVVCMLFSEATQTKTRRFSCWVDARNTPEGGNQSKKKAPRREEPVACVQDSILTLGWACPSQAQRGPAALGSQGRSARLSLTRTLDGFSDALITRRAPPSQPNH